MNIIYETHPEANDVDFLTDMINQEAHSSGIKKSTEPFALFVRDATGNIIAGCNGAMIYGSIYTDQLWVNRTFRGRGLGKKLMEKVHEIGYSKGCIHATVCTMSFQNAEMFYRKLGYSIDFKRTGYYNKSECLFLSKTLSEPFS